MVSKMDELNYNKLYYKTYAGNYQHYTFTYVIII